MAAWAHVPTAAQLGDPGACVAQLARIIASICAFDAEYTAWNAASPGWQHGPVLERVPSRGGQPPTVSGGDPAGACAAWRAHTDAGVYRVSPTGVRRAQAPILCEETEMYAALAAPARPLSGLAAFRRVVEAELRYAEREQRAPSGHQLTSNIGFLQCFWDEVRHAAVCHSPITALDAVVPGGAGATCTSDVTMPRVDASPPGVRINILAGGGSHWLKLVPTRPDALLAEFRECDATEQEVPSAVDEAVEQCSLLRIARELRQAAQQQRTPPECIELVLPRLGGLPTAEDGPPPASEAYWAADEAERSAWRLAAVLRAIRALHIQVRLEVRRAPDVRDAARVPCTAPLPPSPPPPAVRITATLNLDVSVLVALASDVTHTATLPAGTPMNRALEEQMAHELDGEHGFLQILAEARRAAGAHQLALVTTPSAKQKLREIAAAIGTPSERERIHLMFDSAPDAAARFWALSPVSQGGQRDGLDSWLRLPVQTLDEPPAARPQHTYKHDTPVAAYAKRCTTMLDRLASREARPKSLSSSLHTVESLRAGAQLNITTLTSHAHGVRELAQAMGGEDFGVPEQGAAQHAFVWLTLPRSLAGTRATGGGLPPGTPGRETPGDDSLLSAGKPDVAVLEPSSNPSENGTERDTGALDGDATLRDASSFASKQAPEHTGGAYVLESPSGSPTARITPPSPTSSSSSEAPIQPHEAENRASRFFTWLSGPNPPKVHTLRHYPWWPFEHAERAWLRLTSRVAWRQPPPASLPAWYTADDAEQHELATFSSSTTDAAPLSRARGFAWLSAVHAEWRVNKLHWLLLAAVCIGWLFGFSAIVHQLWFNAKVHTEHGWSTPEHLSCTDAFWGRNAECATDGVGCAPFDNVSMSFRCPGGCSDVTLLNPRTVGTGQYNYMPLVVGGAPAPNAMPLYRGDSFVCSAAQHAGVLGPNGGCARLKLVGPGADYKGSVANGIRSVPFAPPFPLSLVFEPAPDSQNCDDHRYRAYVLDVVLSAFVTLVLRPHPLVLFWVLAIVGFWHVPLVSELRGFPPKVGAAVGDFLPHLFVSYAIWRVALRYLWPPFARMPLEFGIATLGLWWIGVLLDVVFKNVPLQRLVAHDIAQQPGSLVALIVVLVIAIIVGVNQIRVIRAAGCLPRYLAWYVVGGVLIALGTAVPGEGVRIHHYIIGLAFLPACGFPTRISLLLGAFLYGMYTNGVARWGFAGILQDAREIQGDATGNSLLPKFAMSNVSLGTGAQRIVRWEGVPASAAGTWDTFMLLVDDVLRYEGSNTEFNLSSLLSDLPGNATSYALGLVHPEQLRASLQHGVHYLRLAYAKNGQAGDFTMPAQAWLNGTWIPPAPGRT